MTPYLRQTALPERVSGLRDGRGMLLAKCLPGGAHARAGLLSSSEYQGTDCLCVPPDEGSINLSEALRCVGVSSCHRSAIQVRTAAFCQL